MGNDCSCGYAPAIVQLGGPQSPAAPWLERPRAEPRAGPRVERPRAELRALQRVDLLNEFYLRSASDGTALDVEGRPFGGERCAASKEQILDPRSIRDAAATAGLAATPPADISRATSRLAPAPDANKAPSIHMIICALDYEKTRCPLTCSVDGRNMSELAYQCRANVETLYNEDATVANVGALIRKVGARCGPHDVFVFYYAGHGANLPDQDGDEEDGKDEAFCFVDEHGQTSPDCWLRDDDFASLVTASVHAETQVLILADCCHSGTVADLSKSIWDGYRVASISGCKDQQTSGDTGKGGIFTHSMLLAIDELTTRQQDTFTVGDLYRHTTSVDDRVFNSVQDITIQARPCDGMVWPLTPAGPYVAPLRRSLAAKATSGVGPAVAAVASPAPVAPGLASPAPTGCAKPLPVSPSPHRPGAVAAPAAQQASATPLPSVAPAATPQAPPSPVPPSPAPAAKSPAPKTPPLPSPASAAKSQAPKTPPLSSPAPAAKHSSTPSPCASPAIVEEAASGGSSPEMAHPLPTLLTRPQAPVDRWHPQKPGEAGCDKPHAGQGGAPLPPPPKLPMGAAQPGPKHGEAPVVARGGGCCVGRRGRR